MPVEKFEVVVSSKKDDHRAAIADASQYLAYADQTDTFGYHGDVLDVDARKRRNGQEGSLVRIEFKALMPTDDNLKQFMGEMATLSRVQSSVARRAA